VTCFPFPFFSLLGGGKGCDSFVDEIERIIFAGRDEKALAFFFFLAALRERKDRSLGYTFPSSSNTAEGDPFSS